MDLFKKTEHPILEPREDIEWASGAVFNPAASYDGERIHLLFRAVPAGYRRVPLPDSPDGEPTHGFEPYVSYIGYANSLDGEHFDVRATPFICPDSDFDRFGAEDPRLTRIDDRFYITYTALSAEAFGTVDGVRIGLASTANFDRVEKHGIIGPAERDKDAVIFPARIGGRIAMLHRIVPDIQIVYFDSLDELRNPARHFWRDHLESLDRHVVLRPREPWERKKIGAGPPPIRTEEGWILIYHGVDEEHVYRSGLALLDLNDPARVIARMRRPVLEPELEFERIGDVNNVVFPEGAVVIDGILHVYYGAADRVVGHARAELSDLIAALRSESL